MQSNKGKYNSLLEIKTLQELRFDIMGLFCDVKTKGERLGRTMSLQKIRLSISQNMVMEWLL